MMRIVVLGYTKMDLKYLEEIKSRLSAASPGPWRTPEESIKLHGNRLAPYDDPHVVLDHEGCAVWPWNKEADMIFAYNARTDIEALLNEIDRLLVLVNSGE